MTIKFWMFIGVFVKFAPANKQNLARPERQNTADRGKPSSTANSLTMSPGPKIARICSAPMDVERAARPTDKGRDRRDPEGALAQARHVPPPSLPPRLQAAVTI
jgi:hypothetical protein